MSRRRGVQVAALLALAVGIRLGHDALAARLGFLTALLGSYLVDLLLDGLVLALVLAAAWSGRRLLARGARAVGATLERLDRALLGRLSKRVRVRAAGLAIGLFACLVVLWLSRVSDLGDGFVMLENRVSDTWLSWMSPRPSGEEAGSERRGGDSLVRDDIVIVAMDDETLARLGWPLPRHHHKALIDAIARGRPRTIFYNVMFLDPGSEHPEWDAEIGAAAARAGNVYFGFPIESGFALGEEAEKIGRSHGLDAAFVAGRVVDGAELAGPEARAHFAIAPVARGARGQSPINVPSGDDGIVRQAALAIRLGDRVYLSPALRLASDVWGLEPERLQAPRPQGLSLDPAAGVPLDGRGFTEVRFLGRWDPADPTFPYYPLWQVLRREVGLTLPGSPLGSALLLDVDAATELSLDGQPLPLGRLDTSLLFPGRPVQGRLLTAAGSAPRLAALDLRSGPAAAVPAYAAGASPDELLFTDVVGQATFPLDPRLFTGKHVLIGATASGAHDIKVTPLGEMPGVEYHATVLANLLDGRFIGRVASTTDLLLVVLAGALVGLVVPTLRPGPSLVFAGAAVAVLGTGLYIAFVRGHHAHLVPPLVTLLLGYTLVTAYNYRIERSERAEVEARSSFIRQTFGRYLSETVVANLLGSPEGLKLGGDRRRATIMMTDLRGFTSLSASLQPESVVLLLNNYLSVMTDIIVKYRGTIDEFIGDAILVVFGAPIAEADDEARAVACAVEMQQAMTAVNAWNRSHDLPELGMGIGINTGEVVVGNIGSEKRAKYGVVGATINLCSRIEGFTVGGQILIAESTRQGAGATLRIDDQMSVLPKGASEAITIYQVGGVGPPYNVSLPEQTEFLVELKPPVRLRYHVLEGKYAGTDYHDAEAVKLSSRGAELRLARDLEPLTDLKLALIGAGGERLPGDFYAKVLRPTATPHVCYVRFTSVPAEIRKPLQELIDDALQHTGPIAWSSTS